ncbi:hypothetical protein CYLTODRAFT_420225 [Cylindrobasidium torrendii FP15055 ss-10]|uniref:F-box domain-containing protein n=1 Tax=Cylindrobasidium torrendii FP15055 ss-10 TaxID=1314674 RepID=A0A0D7BI50_9AGAR|nr:hypothetical protein CYLTODRAFT_420225 [Cylindrobasidium torrendii FP15055 ss-10]
MARTCGAPAKRRRYASLKSITSNFDTPIANFRPLDSLPLEIFFEIIGWLEPPQLLKLSMVSHSFRTALCNSRHASHIWSESRSLIDQPKPALGMSELEWAQLCFVKACSVCGTREKANAPDFYLRKRLCRDCKRFDYPWKITFKHSPFLGTLFTTPAGSRSKYLLVDLDAVNAQWDASPDERSKALYLQGRREYVEAHTDTQHAAQAHAWMKRYDAKQDFAKFVQCNRRFKAVISHLHNSEYRADLANPRGQTYQALRKHPSVWLKAPLTDEEWQRIKDDVIQTLETTTVSGRTRIMLDLRTKEAEATNVQYCVPLIPGPADWLALPVIKSVIQSNFPDVQTIIAPSQGSVDSTNVFSTHLREETWAWQARVRSDLQDMYADHPSRSGFPFSLSEYVSLARAAVVCNDCDKPLFWPEAFTHSCNINITSGKAMRITGEKTWEKRNFSVNMALISLIERFTMNVDICASVEALDGMGDSLKSFCGLCARIMGWRDAVRSALLKS